MRLNIRTCCVICVLASALGCSSNNNSTNPEDVVENPGDGDTPGDIDSSLTGIAAATPTSEPVTLDIATLQDSLNSLQGLEPVQVDAGDTVTSLLEKAR